MVNTAGALTAFYNSFGLPAYMEDNVPDDVERPYITYQIAEAEWNMPVTHYARIWYRDISNAAILGKVDEIKSAIGSGVRIDCDGGCIVIRQDNPFAQIQVEDGETHDKYAYLNMQLNCYHL